MELFDAFLPIGRTNGARRQSPTNEAEALALMDRFGVTEAFALHTVALDSDPDLGNAALDVTSQRLHKVFAFDPSAVIPECPADFLARALAGGARAILVNPLMRGVRVDRSSRTLDLAGLLEEKRIPLIAAYRQWDGGQDAIDWYQLADFCQQFPRLPVIAWELRARSNRPMFDALLETGNLKVVLSAVWQAQMVEAVCETFGADRLLFSLGLPCLDPAAFVGVIGYAAVDDSARRAVTSGNAARLLREADYG